MYICSNMKKALTDQTHVMSTLSHKLLDEYMNLCLDVPNITVNNRQQTLHQGQVAVKYRSPWMTI